MSAEVRVPRDVLEAGLPAQLLGFYTWLLGRSKLGAAQRDACGHFGVTRQTVWEWSRDLEAIGLLEQRRAHRFGAVRYFAKRQETLTLRKADRGKAARCVHPGCGTLIKTLKRGGLGDYCAVHKQSHRKDSAWWLEAEPLLRQRLSPFVISAKLERRGVHCPVWDYLLSDRIKRMPGLVTKGVRAGLLGPEWLDRQRRALAGDDDDGDVWEVP